MKCVWILGASGCGKSTLARQLSQKMGARCIDLDELHWRPDWQTTPEAEFIAALEQATESPCWVIAGNYSKIQARFLPRADTIIWLDYSLPVVLWRQIKRIWRRVVHNEPCCNGNYETISLTFSRDSVLLWLLRTYNKRRRSGWNTKRRAHQSGMGCLHFRHPSQCARWLQTIGKTESAR